VVEIFESHVAERLNIDSVEDEMSHFLNAVNRGFSQRSLNFQGFNFKMNILTRVPKLLRLCPQLTKVNLFNNLIRDSGVLALCQILLANPQITSLNVGCNDLSEGCSVCLGDLIRDSAITHLQLGCPEISWQINRFSSEALSQIVQTVASVNRIKCLGMSRLMSTSTRKASRTARSFPSSIAHLVEHSDRLSTLDISNLGFTEGDQFPLAEGFSRNKYLRYLNISGNSFPTGTRLVESILQITTLRYLDISNCKLQSSACIAIASVLKRGWALISLDLSHNRIGQLGAQVLFEALAVNTTLTV
jgi:hypothetical protein